MSERALSTGIKEIDSLSEELKIRKTVSDDAKKIFLQALEGGFFLRNSRNGAKAALYAACRLHNESIPFNYIGGYYVEDRKKVFRAYLQLKRGLNLAPMPVSAAGILPTLCSRLGVPDDVESKAEGILRKIHDASNDRRSPQIVALASIDIASTLCGYRISLREMHEATGSSVSTIRSATRSMAEELGIEPVAEVVQNFCALLDLPVYVSRTALDTLDEVKKSSARALKRPVNVLAAAVVYLAAKRSDVVVSLREISVLAGAKEQSVKNACSELERILNEALRFSDCIL